MQFHKKNNIFILVLVWFKVAMDYAVAVQIFQCENSFWKVHPVPKPKKFRYFELINNIMAFNDYIVQYIRTAYVKNNTLSD